MNRTKAMEMKVMSRGLSTNVMNVDAPLIGEGASGVAVGSLKYAERVKK